MKNREFLMWLHERLVHVHGENEMYDYMHKLRTIIADTPAWKETQNVAQPKLEELKKRLERQDKEREEDERPPTKEELENAGLSRCEQCGETAWDGRICHACGAKDI